MASSNGRLEELLIRRATEGLTSAERSELQALLETRGHEDTEAYDRAAAAIHVGALGGGVKLPPALRERIEQQAMRYLAGRNRADSADNNIES